MAKISHILVDGTVVLKGERRKVRAKATVKEANYTPEMTAKVVEAYTGGLTVEAIAEMVGKSTRSIIAKLTREKVYVKKVYKTKTGEDVAKKDSLADKIGEILGMTENDTDSLAKANKVALKMVLDALQKS